MLARKRKWLLGLMFASALLPLPHGAKADPVSHDVTQTVINDSPVWNLSDVIDVPPYAPPVIGNAGDPITLGTNASISISATGAAASVSVSAVNSGMPNPDGGFGIITQSVANTGTVNNSLYDYSKPMNMDLAGGNVGVGASISVAATGAVGSVSASYISDGSGPAVIGLPAIGSLVQAVPYAEDDAATHDFTAFPGLGAGVSNTGAVTNTGAIYAVGELLTGASASVSASGAVASNSVQAVTGATTPTIIYASNIGAIDQSSENQAEIKNQFGSIEISGDMGTAASASLSASGAVASTSFSYINSQVQTATSGATLSIGPVYQSSLNETGAVTNQGQVVLTGSQQDPLPPDLGSPFDLGQGASVSVSASGAVSAMSISAVQEAAADPATVDLPNIGGEHAFTVGSQSWGVIQLSKNTSDITNFGLIDGVGALGQGASASIAATGAAASFSIAANGATFTGDQTGATSGAIQGVQQNVLNQGAIQNSPTADLEHPYGGSVTVASVGTGGSVSASATGAVASTSFSLVNGNMSEIGSLPNAVAVTAAISQGATNNGTVTNDADITLSTGGLGIGASASISASGAVASVSIAAVSDAPADMSLPSFDVIETAVGGVENTAAVTNTGTLSGAGDLDIGATVSVSATGAVGSVSTAYVAGDSGAAEISLPSIAAVSQYVPYTEIDGAWHDFTSFPGLGAGVTNSGAITNTGAVTGVGDIGMGGSVAVSASGAVASNSVQVAAAGTVPATVHPGTIGAIDQSAQNDGSVKNLAGSIAIGGDLGTAASASISATGAVASTSFSYINSGVGPVTAGDTLSIGPVYQSSLSQEFIKNEGTLTLSGSDLGQGASASVSASGAVSSLSISAVREPGVGALTVALPNIGGEHTDVSQSWGVIQLSKNLNPVYNSGKIQDGGVVGVGASASVSATGAAASFGISANGAALTGEQTGFTSGTIAGIQQNVRNEGPVQNLADSEVSVASVDTGGSASIAATGAVASTSFSMVNGSMSEAASLPYAVAFSSPISQAAYNSSTVENKGGSVVLNSGNLGKGASASVSASGAVASVSVSAVSDGLSGTVLPSFDSIGKLAGGVQNEAAVTNKGSVVINGTLGSGASASVSATGAAQSFSVSAVSTGLTGSEIGGVTQGVTNNGAISNRSGMPLLAGGLGTGASASTSATGAAASVGINLVNSPLTGLAFGADGIDQTVTDTGGSNNNLGVSLGGGTVGRGASVSASATGGIASYSVSAVADGPLTSGDGVIHFPNVAGSITQTVTGSGAGNTHIDLENIGDLSTGASVSASASSAVAAISLSANNVDLAGGSLATGLGASITQSATGTAQPLNNTNSGGTGNVTVGSLGDGASASMSATGAVASLNISLIDVTSMSKGFTIGNIDQTALSTAGASNGGNSPGKTTLTVGALSGAGASASLGATGAVASTAYSTTSNQSPENKAVTFGNVVQTATNEDKPIPEPPPAYPGDPNFVMPSPASVTNMGAINIGGAGLTGVGSSASISATGAAASFSVASINDNTGLRGINIGTISQTVTSSSVGYAVVPDGYSPTQSSVTNTGTISFSAGGTATLGAGASASISATGAAASVSFRTVH